MKISVRDAGSIKIVDVQGDVDMGTSPDLRKVLLATLPDTTRLASPRAAMAACRLLAIRPHKSRDSDSASVNFVALGSGFAMRAA